MVHAVIPFHVDFAPGSPLYEQVVYAATKAIVSGRLRPCDDFPSVRVLSRELSPLHRSLSPDPSSSLLLSIGLLSIRFGRERLS
jgi:hypothetical protein